MDINMPLMDGIEATQKIRMIETEQQSPRSCIIALTAAETSSGQLKSEYQHLGFDGLEGKPISKNTFCLLVNKYLVSNLH